MSKSAKFDLDDVIYLMSALLPSLTGAALAAMQSAGDTRNTHIEELNVYKGSVGQDPRKAGAYGYQTEGDIIRKPYPVDEGLEAAKEFVSNMGGNHTDDAHGQFLADMDNAAAADDEQCNDCLYNPDCSECADDGDDNPTPNGLEHRLMFKNEAGAWHANVILDEGSRDYGVIVDGPHRGKRAHRGNFGLWAVESAVDDRFRNLELDEETDITHKVPPSVGMRTDELWQLMFDKYHKLDVMELLMRKSEFESLFAEMVNIRQTGAIPGPTWMNMWVSNAHKMAQARLEGNATLGQINLRRAIRDNPQA